jgi:hypothetical protein
MELVVVKEKKKLLQNKELEKEIKELLKKHKVKNMNTHIKNMKAGGLFDVMLKVGKKAVEVGKKAYDFYKNNEDTINQAVDLGMKYAPKVYKKITGGKINEDERVNKR